MATDTTANNTDYIHSPDFDGFINEPPYCYGWTTNANGVKVPVFPYVISVLGHLNLKKLGVQPEEEERSTQLMKNTLAVYLEQIIKRWQMKSHFGPKKPDLPLIILINIADKIGELITDVVEKLQKKYPFVRLIAVLPMPKDEFVQQLKDEEKDSENIQAFETRYDEFKRDDTNDQKYIWELSEREMPHMAKQTKLKKWRMFNEFVAQHSHLMIVFWQGEKDNWRDQDDSLTWAVRYKLEGYPGLSRHEQNDLITYPATGPILHIHTELETFQKSKDFLPVYYYSDRATITEEKDGERKLIITDPKFWNLEQLRHSWFGRKFSDIGRNPEIANNFPILKDLNYACQDKNNPLKNPPLREYVEKFVADKYEKSHKKIDKKDIPETDKPTGQLIAYYNILDTLTNYYEGKTRHLVNLFCGTFLLLLVANVLLIFLNDICTMGFGQTIYGLSQYYLTQWIPQQLSLEKHLSDQFIYLFTQFLPQSTPDYRLNYLINSQSLIISRMIGVFVVTCFTLFLCIITIFYCCISSFKHLWHYKYHQFKTLADCLSVQVFWKIAGMDYSVSANFRSHQISAVDWLLMALNGLNVTIPYSEKIESTQKLRDRIKMLDTIWIEHQCHGFEEMTKKSNFDMIWGNLTLFSKLIAFVVISLIPFLTVFLFANFGIQSFWGKPFGFEGLSFETSILEACGLTILVWLIILAWFISKAIQNWLEKHLKWAEKEYKTYKGFLGNIYRTIRRKNTSKHFFLVPNSSKLFHFCIILVACFGGFFELRRSNMIFATAHEPSFIYVHYFLFRMIIHIGLSLMAIWWLFRRMSLATKKRRGVEQLTYPFELADYSVDTLLGDKIAFENISSSIWDDFILRHGRSSQYTRSISQNNEEDNENAKIKLCQRLLLELGQEVLAKRADWLLAVSDRNLQSPK